MRARRVSRTGREAAPEVHDGHAFADRGHVDQLVVERGISVDGGVDRGMQFDDLRDAAHVVPEPVHEGRIVMEQCAEGRHVVVVPGGLKCWGCVFGLLQLDHVEPRMRL